MSVKRAIQEVLLWRGLNFLSVFILNVLVARSFQASEAGSLFFFTNNLSLVILVLSFSIESGMIYYAAAGKPGYSNLAMLALLWTFLASLLVFLFFGKFSIGGTSLHGINATLSAACFITGNLLITFYSALYSAQRFFFIPNLCLLVVNIVLIGIFLTGMNGSIPAQWLLYFYFAGFLVQGLCICIFYFLRNRGDNYTLPPAADIRKVIKYSSIAFFANIIFFLVYRVDYWFVETYCTPVELGNYIQVSKIVQWFLLVPTMVSSVIFPVTASGKDSAIVDKIAAVSRVLFWLYLFICIGIALTGFWAFVWIFGKSYTYMYPVFLLHIPGVLALATLYPVSSYHAGIKRIDINIKGCLLALVVIILLNCLFTPAYGIFAASIANSIGYMIYFIFSLQKFTTFNKSGLAQFFKTPVNDYAFLKSMFFKK